MWRTDVIYDTESTNASGHQYKCAGRKVIESPPFSDVDCGSTFGLKFKAGFPI